MSRKSRPDLWQALAHVLVAILALLAALLDLAAASISALAVRIRPKLTETRLPPKEKLVQTAPPRGLPPPLPSRPEDTDAAPQVEYALKGMGFKSPEVRRFVAGLGKRTRGGNVAELVREGIVKLGS